MKAKVKALIVTGYGVNCEEETSHALNLSGADSQIVHINDLIENKAWLKKAQILVFPGGFSYGDDTGSGKALANKIKNNIFDEIKDFIKDGNLVIGICNGFQVLANLGLLPALGENYGEKEAALIHNKTARFECRWVNIINQSKKCVWTKGIKGLEMPIAHGEGNFYASSKVLQELIANDQVVFRYAKNDGTSANGEYPFNPNGALSDIAGICDPTGRVFGIMPHPERAIYWLSHPDYQINKEIAKRNGKKIPEIYSPALKVFENAVNYFTK